MFKRTGAPAKIDEVLTFDIKTAAEILCPKCKSYCGFRSGSLSKKPGKGPEIMVGEIPFTCPKCGESFNHV
jgi:transcription initiation factor IIE alpha subunit